MLETALFLWLLTNSLDRPAPAGQAAQPAPLSLVDHEAVLAHFQPCWNVGTLSSDALRTTVVLGMEMNRDGTPVIGSIRMISASGGSDTAANQAYEAARRAIIRCGAAGLPLPPEKYPHWRSFEMTFDPSEMRLR